MDSPQSDLEQRRAALRANNLAQLNQPVVMPPAADERPAGPGLPSIEQRKPWEAFKTAAILLSFVINIVLLFVAGALLVSAPRVFDLRNQIAAPLLNGLHDGFVDMDNAHIRTTITVNDSIVVDDTLPVVFDLPLQTQTVVTLTQPVLITGATVDISGGVLVISDAPTTILLPANTPLPVELSLVVPVSQTVPVHLDVPVRLTVPVDIALSQTDLHQPFADLRDLVAPYKSLVNQTPATWREMLCRPIQALCQPAP